MIAALLLAAAATGAGFQDTAALDRAVAAFTARPIGSEGGARAPVDARLRLAACPMVAMSWRTEVHDAVVIACAGPAWRLFVITGFLGGLTTFSSCSAESMVLLQRGQLAWALGHATVHLVGSIACCFAGFATWRALAG